MTSQSLNEGYTTTFVGGGLGVQWGGWGYRRDPPILPRAKDFYANYPDRFGPATVAVRFFSFPHPASFISRQRIRNADARRTQLRAAHTLPSPPEDP